MTDIMNVIANFMLSTAITLWNFCTSTWLLAFPIALAMLSRFYDLAKRFLGK